MNSLWMSCTTANLNKETTLTGLEPAAFQSLVLLWWSHAWKRSFISIPLNIVKVLATETLPGHLEVLTLLKYLIFINKYIWSGFVSTWSPKQNMEHGFNISLFPTNANKLNKLHPYNRMKGSRCYFWDSTSRIN